MIDGSYNLSDLENMLPAAWDLEYIAKNVIGGQGITIQEAFGRMAETVNAFNLSLRGDGPVQHEFIPAISSFTSEMGVSYGEGNYGSGMRLRSQLSLGDAKRQGKGGHMFPILDSDYLVAWTQEYISKKASDESIEADIIGLLANLTDTAEALVLHALFRFEDETVGGSGISPGLVGGGSLAWAPPQYRGKSFDTSHSHFARVGTDIEDIAAALNVGTAHLTEHGHMPPFIGIIPGQSAEFWMSVKSDIEGVTPLRVSDSSVIYGANETRLAMPRDDMRIYGAILTRNGPILLVTANRIEPNPGGNPSDTYVSITKSYGPGDQRNAVAIRYDEKYGSGVFLMNACMDDVSMANGMAGIVARWYAGAGIRNRTNGYNLAVGPGSYLTPEIIGLPWGS